MRYIVARECVNIDLMLAVLFIIMYGIYSLFQTSLPLTHVPSTPPLRSRTTKSASAPEQSVPFQFSILRHRAGGLYTTHLIASPREHPVKREKLRTQLSNLTTLSDVQGQASSP